MTHPSLSRRDLLRNAGIGAGVLAGASLLGAAVPAIGRSLVTDVPADGLTFARVWPRTPAQLRALATFDDTHMLFADGSMEYLLWPGDRRKLDALGVDYQVFSGSTASTGAVGRPNGLALQPGERAAYRRLPQYNADLAALAAAHPVQSKLFKFPEPSLEGREVFGIEIADDIDKARSDGRPVFWVDGVHHAREWPSSELTIMFAYDLLEANGKEARITDLLTKLRVIVVPVVNPDGFNHSREALIDNSLADAGQMFAYWRKNKRSVSDALYSLGKTNGHLNADAHGTDPNRNYPFFWGGEGGGSDPTSQTYGGKAPFAEPEARNIANVMKANQVTAYLTNHTSGRLCMRPWGYTNAPSPDNDLQEDLGAQMCAFHKYNNQIGLSLYPTSGTSRDWSYGALRTIVYTFEHCTAFHPDYATTIPSTYALNRKAWLLLAEAAISPANHGVITGRVVDATGAPIAGAVVELTKSFRTPTATEVTAKVDGGIPETIVSTAKAAADGTFTVHANPSTRPTTIQDGRPDETWTVNLRDGGRVTSSQVFLDRGTLAALGDVTV